MILEHSAHAECGKNYKIILLVMLTSVLTQKSNAQKEGPLLCYGAKLQSNTWDMSGGMGSFGNDWYINEFNGDNASLCQKHASDKHL